MSSTNHSMFLPVENKVMHSFEKAEFWQEKWKARLTLCEAWYTVNSMSSSREAIYYRFSYRSVRHKKPWCLARGNIIFIYWRDISQSVLWKESSTLAVVVRVCYRADATVYFYSKVDIFSNWNHGNQAYVGPQNIFTKSLIHISCAMEYMCYQYDKKYHLHVKSF